MRTDGRLGNVFRTTESNILVFFSEELPCPLECSRRVTDVFQQNTHALRGHYLLCCLRNFVLRERR
jgi:hypothetical protein